MDDVSEYRRGMILKWHYGGYPDEDTARLLGMSVEDVREVVASDAGGASV